MAAFTVVYTQLTALQVGAKYLKRDLMSIISYYKKQVENLKAKAVAYADMGNTSEVEYLEKEIANYEKFIRKNEPKGVDSYFS